MSLQAAQPSQKMLDMLNARIRSQEPFEFTGTLAAGSAVVTAVADTGPINVGNKIYLTIVDASAPLTVLSKTSSTITLSAVAGTTQVGAKLVTVAATSEAPSAWKVGLFTGNPTLSLATVLADLTQPTFTGYALAASALLAVRQDTEGNVIDPLTPITFQPTVNPVTPETATGVLVVATLGGVDVLMLSESLTTAFVFADTMDAFTVQMDLYTRNQPQYGGICSIC